MKTFQVIGDVTGEVYCEGDITACEEFVHRSDFDEQLDIVTKED